jgi:hypothetical protein
MRCPASPVGVYQDAFVLLDPPPRMDEWRLPLIVQLVNFRSRNGTIPAVPARALQKGDWETMTEFLDRLVEPAPKQRVHRKPKTLFFSFLSFLPHNSTHTAPTAATPTIRKQRGLYAMDSF